MKNISNQTTEGSLGREGSAPSSPAKAASVKRIPEEQATRDALRRGARDVTGGLSRANPLPASRVETIARQILANHHLPDDYLGFAMVAVDNEFWREQFAAVPMRDRLLLLPHCLRDSVKCAGVYDNTGLHCKECGSCVIVALKSEAEELGYRVIVAEGTPTVVQHVLRGQAVGLLGVACLDSLEKAFDRVAKLGIPHAAVPLLRSGCANTAVEADVVRQVMTLSSEPPAEKTRVYFPLLRAAAGILEDANTARLLAPLLSQSARDAVREHGHGTPDDSFSEAETVAVEWLGVGGKRFRPFITLAAYAAMTWGDAALEPSADVAGKFTDAVRRVALAIEVMHKASLVHDDIEDGDAFRYGQETLHQKYGIPVAVNVGDYLIGLGYRLVAHGADELGKECVADILGALSEAHLKLCRGQGAEFAERRKPPSAWTPQAMQSIYALKTTPAFEVAFFAGFRMAGEADHFREPLAAYSRYLGVAYQVKNDLEDYDVENTSKTPNTGASRAFSDSVPGPGPTILRAFATSMGGVTVAEDLERIEAGDMPPYDRLLAIRRLYEEAGVFEKARRLIDGCRKQALKCADGMPHEAFADLMRFVVDMVS